MILFDDKKKCCGCGTCVVTCSQNAITMKVDEYGFLYPVIQKERCIECEMCKEVCAFQKKNERKTAKAVYAVARKNGSELIKSASGGAFSGIASEWIRDGGVVFGSAMLRENGKLITKHISVTSEEELSILFGSKYVQSDVGKTYIEAKKLLDKGEKVLYSGTPCQIAGLKSYLHRSYDNLLTIDLICHGVPSSVMFQDYIALLEKKKRCTIQNFKFRDKTLGRGYNAKVVYRTKNDEKIEHIPSYQSSYYDLFLRGELLRESCYHCPYANSSHPADLTIGDYWGLDQVHRETVVPIGKLRLEEGVSVILINSEAGISVFNRYKNQFFVYPSTYEKASCHNGQLKRPSSPGENRNLILEMYKSKGYSAIENWFMRGIRRRKQKEWIAYHVHNDIPESIRKVVKKILGR